MVLETGISSIILAQLFFFDVWINFFCMLIIIVIYSGFWENNVNNIGGPFWLAKQGNGKPFLRRNVFS